ncbi:hypothetical protein HJG60_011086 [Phyllostomus discolor]|uniref:Uncharacterized protein n=1 Tax=Phyllostomus discolor TaxID=89673 RepID=A0A833ZW15_9CHIR|nr:hypothetical protein HJG60_011086 [Phyllostomus discolor]
MPLGCRYALAGSEVGCSCSQIPRVPRKPRCPPRPRATPSTPREVQCRGLFNARNSASRRSFPGAFLALFPAGSPRKGGLSCWTAASETSLGARAPPLLWSSVALETPWEQDGRFTARRRHRWRKPRPGSGHLKGVCCPGGARQLACPKFPQRVLLTVPEHSVLLAPSTGDHP